VVNPEGVQNSAFYSFIIQADTANLKLITRRS
jgi:hypothetical protein